VHRLAFQCDVGARKAACWLDGRALDGDPPPWKPGVTLAVNHRTPWRVCGAGATINAVQSDSQSLCPREQIDLYGLSLAAGPRYDFATGRRLDGAATTDQLAYFTDWSPVVAMLPLQDDPALVVADRTTAVRLGTQANGAYGWGTALVLSPEHAPPNANTGEQAVRGLAISAAGDAIVLGQALYLTVADCTLQGGGGGAGIGSWKSGANYTTVLRDCRATGPDAAVFLYYAMASIEGLRCESAGRHGVWLDRGSRVRMRRTFFGPYGDPESYFRVDGGSDLVADDTAIDHEDGKVPSVAVVWATADRSTAKSLGARAVVRDLELGALNRAVPVARVDGRPGAPKGLLELSGVTTSGAGLAPMRGVVAADDYARWTVRVDAPGLEGWPRFVAPAGK
jgi:hypothetical protein